MYVQLSARRVLQGTRRKRAKKKKEKVKEVAEMRGESSDIGGRANFGDIKLLRGHVCKAGGIR